MIFFKEIIVTENLVFDEHTYVFSVVTCSFGFDSHFSTHFLGKEITVGLNNFDVDEVSLKG